MDSHPDEREEAHDDDADEATNEAPDQAATAEEPSLEEQLAEAEDKLLRAMAEVQNVRRRSRLDVDEARRYGSSSLLADLLSVIDNFQRALATPPEGTDQGFLDGVAMIEQSLLSILGSHGVSAIDAQRGQTADPTVHRVLLEQEDAELEPGQITAEILRGYRLHDRLLREAQVAVAKAPADDGDA